MRNLVLTILIASLALYCCTTPSAKKEKIDRFALVNRHNVMVNAFDSLTSLTVGNGGFAFTVDPTGLQSFPEVYDNGVCLGTMSEWGWHSFPNSENFQREETYNYYDVEGRKVPYSVTGRSDERKGEAANYFRVNPHRLHLGLIGFEITGDNGKVLRAEQISNAEQQLNLWEGTIYSTFSAGNFAYKVQTCVAPENDLVAVNIEAGEGFGTQTAVKIRFPFPSAGHVDGAISWEQPENHLSKIVTKNDNIVVFKHQLDTTTYFLRITWEGKAEVTQKQSHYYLLQPAEEQTEFSFTAEFSPGQLFGEHMSFSETKKLAAQNWAEYWQSGGMVDFSGTEDQRAFELERRIILSQYLTRAQCAGNYPPQETGLTFNSWYGKFHLEMHWWHAAHWAYWGRPELLEKSLDYYFNVLEKAKNKAAVQGYRGARWQKMTDNLGGDSPSGVGEFLIWQQPHILYFIEQLYQAEQDTAILRKYHPLITATADFMADFARWEEDKQRYVLGPPLIPAQESLEKEKTVNPPFELAYWHWGLSKAQEILGRLNLAPNEEWQHVIDHLSQLPQLEGKYLAAESAPDSYENEEYYSDHPMVLGTFGMLPETLPLDTGIMAQTFDYIEEHWNWERTWGWDYPMAAMCATRLGKPEQGVDLLLKDVLKNTYLVNGHNYQGTRLRIYLPGNGGLLTAVAMMCAGFEGNESKNPGFPEDWNVKWENLKPLF